MNDINDLPVPASSDFRLLQITNCNHRPHIYMITPRHVAWAADHNCGMLDENSIKEAEENGAKCGQKDCNVHYENHKSDKVLFIKAMVDKPVKDLDGLQEYLRHIKDDLIKLGIDGVAFVEKD